eukprot:10633185-Alexandrium_andersonii.AAC.1
MSAHGRVVVQHDKACQRSHAIHATFASLVPCSRLAVMSRAQPSGIQPMSGSEWLVVCCRRLLSLIPPTSAQRVLPGWAPRQLGLQRRRRCRSLHALHRGLSWGWGSVDGSNSHGS